MNIEHVESENLKNEIWHVMHDISEAVVARDTARILFHYSDDAVFFDIRDSLYYGKEGLKKSWEDCFAESKTFRYELTELKIHVSREIAYSHCLSHVTGFRNDGNKIDLWTRVSNGYVKRNGRWQVEHEHCSVPGDFESGRMHTDLKPKYEN